jgi:hypothetical protein
MAEEHPTRNCPEDVAQAIAQIIQTGVLSIRAAAWNGDAEYCAIEADHLHNLPALLMDFRNELLDYYLDSTRGRYLESLSTVKDANSDAYRPQWERLEQYRSAQGR